MSLLHLWLYNWFALLKTHTPLDLLTNINLLQIAADMLDISVG